MKDIRGNKGMFQANGTFMAKLYGVLGGRISLVVGYG